MEQSINLIGIAGKRQAGKDTVARMAQYLMVPNPIKTKFPDGKGTFKQWMKADYYLAQESGWKNVKFAGKLKTIVSLLTGIPVEELEKEEIKNAIVPLEWYNPIYKQCFPLPHQPTYREFLQKIGTDLFRKMFHENTWVNALMADYVSLTKSFKDSPTVPSGYEVGEAKVRYHRHTFPHWLISDVRFPNEMKAIKDHGGIVVKVNRTVCPKCGEAENFHFNYETHEVEYCNECGHRWDTHASETSLDGYKFDWVIENNGSLEDLMDQVKLLLIHLNLIGWKK